MCIVIITNQIVKVMKIIIVPIGLLCFTAVCFMMLHIDNMEALNAVSEKSIQQEATIVAISESLVCLQENQRLTILKKQGVL